MLYRHVSCLVDMNKKEEFVHALHVPKPWIYQAKAQRLAYETDADMDYVECLLRAHDHNTAHRRIVGRLAPEWILAGEWHALRAYLERLDPQQVAEWSEGGAVLLASITAMEQAQPLLQQLDTGLVSEQDASQETHALVSMIHSIMQGLHVMSHHPLYVSCGVSFQAALRKLHHQMKRTRELISPETGDAVCPLLIPIAHVSSSL